MAKIDIHIDTEDSGSIDSGSLPSKAANKVGLLSTVKISAAQLDGFAKGYGVPKGQIVVIESVSYAPDAIQTGKNSLKNLARCDVIAVTGGLLQAAVKSAQSV